MAERGREREREGGRKEWDFSLRYWIMAPPRRRCYYISLFFLYISIKNTCRSRFRSPVITSFHLWNIAVPLSRGTPTMTLRLLKNELTFAPRVSLDFLVLVAKRHILATSPGSFIVQVLFWLFEISSNCSRTLLRKYSPFDFQVYRNVTSFEIECFHEWFAISTWNNLQFKLWSL